MSKRPVAKRTTTETRSVFSRKITRGPIPPAEELKKLEPLISNVGERFMALLERNVAHSQNMDTQAQARNYELNLQVLKNQELQIRSDANNIRRGQWIVLIIVLAIIFLLVWAGWLYLNDQTIPATIFATIGLLGGVWVRSVVKGYSKR